MIIFKEKRFSLFSRGLRFFKELNKIEELPITKEEYIDFITLNYREKFEPNKVSDEEDDYFVSLHNKIDAYYKKPKISDVLGKIGFSFTRGYLTELGITRFEDIKFDSPKFEQAIKLSYQKILRLPKRYLSSTVGCGYTGICFEYPFGKIEKISFQGFSPKEKQFYSYLIKNKSKVFPKIYTLEDDQVVLERLKTEDPKLDSLKKYIHKYRNKQGFDINIDLQSAVDDLGEDHWFCNLVRNTMSELKKLFGIETVGDFNVCNFGVRKSTGEIVYFDPIGGKLLMS